MDLGDSLQAADVIIGAISLIVTLLGTCLTWYAVTGMPLPNPLCCDSANGSALAHIRRWQRLHVPILPMYNLPALPRINDGRTTASTSTGDTSVRERSVVAFAKQMIARILS
jgi:hypothetical protein